MTIRTRSFSSLFVAGVLLISPFVRAQEVCGLQGVAYDVIFAYGFESGNGVLSNPLGSVAAPATGTAPTVTVTFPASSALLSDQHTAVAGTFTGPDHTGIVVNGQIAYTLNNTFLVPDVPLASTDPALHVTATTLDELTASVSVPVQVPALGSLTRLDADADAGIAPFAIDYTLTVDPARQVQSVAVNYGDGATFSSSGVAGIPTHSYAVPGIYVASATITTTTGSLSADHRIVILDVQQLRNRACGVVAHLRAKLLAQDAGHALQAFDPIVRNRYQSFFTGVGQPQLPQLAAAMGSVAAGTIGPREAHLAIVKSVNGVVEGNPIEFAPDENGVWRITQM